MQDCNKDDAKRTRSFGDIRLKEVIVNVSYENTLVDRQIINSILESLMSLKSADNSIAV